MNKFVLTLVVLLFPVVFFGQELGLNQRINVGEIGHEWYLNGIFFKPLNDSSNLPNSELCDSYTEQFSLNGLNLSKEAFITLHLASRDLCNDNTTLFTRGNSKSGFGTFYFKYESDRSCVNQILYQVKVQTPIVLNGVELDFLKQEEILNKISPNEIVMVEKTRSFFGRSVIYIRTKSP